LPDIDLETTRRILDLAAIAIDGKKSSAKPSQTVPYDDLQTYDDWKQENNDSQNLTARTRALFLAYVLLSGGHIPYTGIPVNGAWLRPDAWVAGSLVKLGYVLPDDGEAAFNVTPNGWALIADTLAGIQFPASV
jgi:hypothetical protein